MALLFLDGITADSSFTFKREPITVEEIFRQCFDDYFNKLYTYAFTIVKNNAEAKDIVQLAFVRLWEKRHDVNLAVSGKAYLYTSVYHLSLNSIRNRKIREGHHQHIARNNSINSLYTVEEKEARSRIKAAIDALPSRCKEVFCKSRFEGKKYAEIAEELGISVKTVEVQVGKALRLLRENLADLGLIALIHLLF
jgi:RNA polymerase sigma-70 factor, ECF subfamily